MALSAVVVTGCKKDNNLSTPVSPAANDSRVKTYTGNDIATYLYDANGRVVKVEYQSGSKSTWEYGSGVIKKHDYTTNGTLNYTYTFELNDNSKVQKTTISNNPGYLLLTQYYPDGTPSKEIFTINGTTTIQDFFYSNGNCDSIRHSDASGWKFTRYFNYYIDKKNVLDYSIWGLDYLAVKSKNLLKTESGIYSNGDAQEPIDFFYEFDNAGRVVKQTSKQGANQNISLYTYY